MTGMSLMIFAAGFGTRMGALTKTMPKPMLPLGGAPMIDRTIALGKAAGVSKIVANTHYLHDRIAPHLARMGVTVLREEPSILDTGGGLKAARTGLTSPTFTANPDVFWRGPNPLTCLANAWDDGFDALLLVVPCVRTGDRIGSGDFGLEAGLLARGGDLVYTGAQLMRPEVLDDIGEATFSLNAAWDRLAHRGALRGVVYPGHWLDIGTPDGLAAANDLLERSDV